MQKTYHVTIETTPHILIYDSNGTLIAQDEGPNKAGYDFFYKWLNDEIQKDWKKRQTR